MVSLVLLEFGGVVFFVLSNAYRLSSPCLAATGIRCARKHARRRAFLGHTMQGTPDEFDMIGLEGQRFNRIARRTLALAGDRIFNFTHQARKKTLPP